MEIKNIPFVAKVGVSQAESGELSLPFERDNKNHLQTLHAGAQFVLAETASGVALAQRFPDLAERVIPVLRDSQIRFKRPALKDVVAEAMISEEAVEKFRQQFERKGRSTITVDVEVKDCEGSVTCAAVFNWFVQSAM